MTQGYVDISDDSIRIYDENNNEIVGWIESEWIEDPSVVISIANAINIFNRYGINSLKAILNKE